MLRVELGAGAGGIKKDAGVRAELVTLLSDRDEVDIGVGNGEAVTLETVVELSVDTEETVVDFGTDDVLLVTERGEEARRGVDTGVESIERLARDIVRD